MGIPMAWEHSALHVAGVSRLAVTKALTSVDPDHPELVEARNQGIPMEPWQQIVADTAVTTGQRLIAVAGTHGKSTTTGWIVDMLVRAGRDPSAFVGALLEPRLSGGEHPATARWGSGPEFVVEADEYAGNFDPYRPAIAVLLNAEWDHPDVFSDEDAVLDAFAAWIRRAPGATLVANMADSGVANVVERLRDWEGTVVAAPDAIPAGWNVGLPGSANADNARSVIGVARVLGLDESVVGESVASYPGVGRRFEIKGEVAGVLVIDDYGHHPTAIAKTLDAVRARYPGRRVWAVYEPLTFHRTAQLLPRFAEVLAAADEVAIADIWAGRDPDTTITSAAALADAVRAAGGPYAQARGSVEATADYLSEHVVPGDVVLVMGGGRSYVIASRLVELLRGRDS
jgi:UDP-N-acetylmuramate--alanine ligase